MIQTHEIEKQIYKLYKMSRDKTNVEQAEKANNLMEEIIRFFQLLDLFMNDQHAEIVKRIYFHRQNMFRIGIRAVSLHAAFFTINNWDRCSPVSLARNQPITQAILYFGVSITLLSGIFCDFFFSF